MSMCLVKGCGNRMLMAADSRASAEKNGQSFAYHDKFRKMVVTDKIVVFAGGVIELSTDILNYFEREKEFNLTKAAQTVREMVAKYKSEHLDYNPDSWYVGVNIGYYEDGQFCICELNPKNNYNPAITRDVISGISGAPSYVTPSAYTWYDYNAPHYTNDIQLFRDFYRYCAAETIGGTLTIAQITPEGAEIILQEPIPDTKPIKRVYSMNGKNGEPVYLYSSAGASDKTVELTGPLYGMLISSRVVGGSIEGAKFKGGIFQVESMENGQITGIQFEYQDSMSQFHSIDAGRIIMTENAIKTPEFRIEANNGVYGVLKGNWNVSGSLRANDRNLLDEIDDLKRKNDNLERRIAALENQQL